MCIRDRSQYITHPEDAGRYPVGKESVSYTHLDVYKRQVFANIIMLQKKNKEFEYMMAPINDQGQEIISLPDVLKNRVLQEYGKESEPLPIVAITDGAKVIRQDLYAVFGTLLVVILDWYHLGKKLRDLMSMIAPVSYTHLDVYKRQGLAEASKLVLEQSGRFNQPIVTTIVPATIFYAAEDYHQHYYQKNPVRYKFYRYSCGRDQRLEELWGTPQ